MRASSRRVALKQVRSSDAALLEAVFAQAPLSRADASELLGISKPTASYAAGRLERAGLIQRAGQATGRRGRAPVLYQPAPEFGWSLALAARSGELAARCIDLTDSVLEESRIELTPNLKPEAFERVLMAELHHLCRQRGKPQGAAVSVAVPVDPSTSRPEPAAEAPFPAADVDLRSLLEPFCHGAVLIDNDVNWAAGWACDEHPDLRRKLVLHVHLGAGLGAALTVNGQVVRGRQGRLGEIMRLRGQGLTVTQRLRRLGALGGSGNYIDVEKALKLIASDEPGGELLCALMAEAVGNAIVVVDPDELVVSGPFVENASARARIRRCLEQQVDGDLPHGRALGVGQDAALLGAHVGARNLLRQAARDALEDLVEA